MASPRVLIRRPSLTLSRSDAELVLEGDASSRDRLARTAAAHRAVRSPHVPGVLSASLEGDSPRVVFACEATVTATTLTRDLVAEGGRFDYGAAIAFNEFLMDATEALHAAGCFLGALSWDNVLIDATGWPWLIGAGDNYPARASAGAVAAPGLVEAPEVTLGHAATAASDVFCLYGTLRGLLPFTELPEFLARLGPGTAGTAAYAEIHTLTERASTPDPLRRPRTVAELRALYRAVRAGVPGMPEADLEGLQSMLARRAQREERTSLRLYPNRRDALLDDRPIDLSRRSAPWRILARLAEEHARAPGQPLALDALVEAGWPGEKILPEAARARVYVALSGLRKLGLEPVIMKRDGGYLLDPDAHVRVESGS